MSEKDRRWVNMSENAGVPVEFSNVLFISVCVCVGTVSLEIFLS